MKILIDSKLKSFEYVDSFGFEWTNIDGYASKEVMSHGHIFGRFLLSPDYFQGKVVADIGCGNGRIGRLVAPHTENITVQIYLRQSTRFQIILRGIM